MSKFEGDQLKTEDTWEFWKLRSLVGMSRCPSMRNMPTEGKEGKHLLKKKIIDDSVEKYS